MPSTVSGPQLFARYAFPPNELGYCGPDDPAGLLVGGAGGSDAEIARRARAFEGAWVYLEVIAAAVGIADPLDARVVEAYWIGNDLLERVDPQWFLATLRERFVGQTGGQWAGGVPSTDGAVRPHHSFHVFEVYPWVGLLGGDSDVPRTILDKCEVSTGTVVAVDGDNALVSRQPLTWDGWSLGIGEARTQPMRWRAGGQSLLRELSVGALVAVHWDWVCDVLTTEQAQRLDECNASQVEIVNRQRAASA